MTKEPFQPVRLYYRIPSRPAVISELRDLECMAEDPVERCWQWLYHGETKALRFATAGYDDVPKERQPIILGRIRFPKSGGMTLQTNSIERAVQAARFFAPHLGSRVVAMRCRVVNRCFAADEGAPDELMKNLDSDVTVIDPRAAEVELEEAFKGVRSMEDAERAAAERLEKKLKSGKDVPLVEDFPLAPEEETPDFQHLATGACTRRTAPARIVFADVGEVGISVQDHEDIATSRAGTRGGVGISWSKRARGTRTGTCPCMPVPIWAPLWNGYVVGLGFAMRSSSAATAALSMRPSATPIVSP